MYWRISASAIDWVFGSNLADAVTGWQAGLTDWLGEMPEGYQVLDKMEHLDIGNFAKKGYTAALTLQMELKTALLDCSETMTRLESAESDLSETLPVQ